MIFDFWKLQMQLLSSESLGATASGYSKKTFNPGFAGGFSHYMLTTESDSRMNLLTFTDFFPYFGWKLREEWLGH